MVDFPLREEEANNIADIMEILSFHFSGLGAAVTLAPVEDLRGLDTHRNDFEADTVRRLYDSIPAQTETTDGMKPSSVDITFGENTADDLLPEVLAQNVSRLLHAMGVSNQVVAQTRDAATVRISLPEIDRSADILHSLDVGTDATPLSDTERTGAVLTGGALLNAPAVDQQLLTMVTDYVMAHQNALSA